MRECVGAWTDGMHARAGHLAPARSERQRRTLGVDRTSTHGTLGRYRRTDVSVKLPCVHYKFINWLCAAARQDNYFVIPQTNYPEWRGSPHDTEKLLIAQVYDSPLIQIALFQ